MAKRLGPGRTPTIPNGSITIKCRLNRSVVGCGVPGAWSSTAPLPLSYPMRPILVFAAALLVASGCMGSRRTAVPPGDLRAARDARQATYETRRAAVVERLAARVAAGDRTVDVLVLSGGGQHGAFGAGFLRGWAARTDSPMPAFDVVTGISTGALLAPFAFVGTPEALAVAADLYRHPERITPRRDVFGALFRGTGALFDTDRIEATLAEVYDARLVADLEPGFAEGRQLFVGTTDLDLGRGRVWDIASETRAAPTREQGAERLGQLLRASTAIPGAFPPVVVDGTLQTDGGIATNLLAFDLQFLQALAREVAARGAADPGADPVRVRLWVIVNLFLSPVVATVNESNVQAVSTRASWLAVVLSQQETLARLWEISEAVNAGAAGDGLSVEMRYAAIPDAWAAEPGAQALFDAPYMNRLQDYGEAQARSAEPWGPMPPGPFE